MKKLIVVILLLFAIAIGVGLILGVFEKEKPIFPQKVRFDFKVGDHVGINADPDAFHFGTMQPGSSGKRTFNFTNTYTFPVKGDVLIVSNMSIGGWFYVEPNPYLIPANSTQIFNISVYVPFNSTQGNYSGEVWFNLTRAEDGETVPTVVGNTSSINTSVDVSSNSSIDDLGTNAGGNLSTDDGFDLGSGELNGTGSS